MTKTIKNYSREEIFVAALTHLLAMHDSMMTKIDHGRTYDTACLTIMKVAKSASPKSVKGAKS